MPKPEVSVVGKSGKDDSGREFEWNVVNLKFVDAQGSEENVELSVKKDTAKLIRFLINSK